MSEASLYERERREKLQKLRDLGMDPYGARTADVQPLASIKAQYKAEMGHDGGPVVKGAGRIILKRDMGKLSFITLRDESGDLQVGLDKKRLDETAWQVRNLLDLGDQIVVEGPLGVTNKGEISIWATSLGMASKALLPPPAKWEGLSDVELRYRQRYVDLWANPEVMRMARLRIRIVEEVRAYLKSKGFEEVETPMMQALAGGAAARPFVTHHNALDIPLFMRIAPELYLKRLLVGGMRKVFELNRNFRNEGISPRHNPEFTMLEAYEAFGSWETMAELVENMICHIAQSVFGTLRIEHKNADGTIRRSINLEGDLSKPAGQRWRRARLVDLVQERAAALGAPWTFRKNGSIVRDAPRLALCLFEHTAKNATAHREHLLKLIETFPADELIQRGIVVKNVVTVIDLESDVAGGRQQVVEEGFCAFLHRLDCASAAEQLVEVYEKLVEPTLIDPTYVTHVPSVIIPLARENKDDPFFADVYELAINGQEISPGYSELNDPDIQAKHFLHQVGEDQQKMDDDFINALKYGMPPAGGMGLGIDRLVMMLTGAESIRDVVLFPLMKPHEKPAGIESEEASPT